MRKRKFAAIKVESSGVQKTYDRPIFNPIKLNKLWRFFDWIDSVDRSKVLRLIDAHAKSINKIMNILIQVKISTEEQKSGATFLEAEQLIRACESLEHICLRGLMTVAEYTDDEAILRKKF